MVEKVNSPAFEIDNRICIKIEKELAAFLGTLILGTDTKNTAVLALGHQLRKLSVEEKSASCKCTNLP